MSQIVWQFCITSCMVIDLWIPVFIHAWQFFRFAACMRIFTMSSLFPCISCAGSCAWPMLCGDQGCEILLDIQEKTTNEPLIQCYYDFYDCYIKLMCVCVAVFWRDKRSTPAMFLYWLEYWFLRSYSCAYVPVWQLWRPYNYTYSSDFLHLSM